MPRENSPSYEPEIDSDRKPSVAIEGEECDACLCEGIHRDAYIMDGNGFLLCRKCLEELRLS